MLCEKDAARRYKSIRTVRQGLQRTSVGDDSWNREREHEHQGRHASERAEGETSNIPEHGSVEHDFTEDLIRPLNLEDARRALVVPRRRKGSERLGL